MSEAAPSFRFYGRRKGRPLRARKRGLMETLLPRLRIDLPLPADPRALFPFRPEALWLEIGFGGGEHLAVQAARHPQTGFIGCEPFLNGIAGLLDPVERDKLNNVRIFPDDARLLLDVLPVGAVMRTFILFPDPWPKARHAGRRFINPENLARLARVMKPGAELRLATDDAQLKEWMAEQLAASKDFALVVQSPNPPVDWVPTRYEQKARAAGRQPLYFLANRRAISSAA
jgi:tRNA (guanine-N7-)-methyltransferase